MGREVGEVSETRGENATSGAKAAPGTAAAASTGPLAGTSPGASASGAAALAGVTMAGEAEGDEGATKLLGTVAEGPMAIAGVRPAKPLLGAAEG